MDPLNLPTYFFRIKEEKEKKYIFDEIRRRFVILTPEEWVRQHLIKFLIQIKNFPRPLISIERAFLQHRLKHRYDLLVFDRKGFPLMIIECKAPGVEVNQNAFDQAGRYNMKHRAPFLLISNGIKHYCCQINLENRQYKFLQGIPDFEEMINDS